MNIPSSESLELFYPDDRGCRRAVISSAKAKLDVFTYSAWGIATQAFGSDAYLRSFTGKDYDASGLIYFNARYYDPVIGRFITEDPSRKGRGWYTYCENNPMGSTDPTGLVIEYGADGSRTNYDATTDTITQVADVNHSQGEIDSKERQENQDKIAASINPDAGKTASRIGAVATSAVETGIGIATLPEGWPLVAHGGANLLAASGSLYGYLKSDGKTEWPTSALGMTVYGLNGDNPEKAAALSSMADLVDDIAGVMISPKGAPSIVEKISTINFGAAQIGNFYLGVSSLIDLHLWR